MNYEEPIYMTKEEYQKLSDVEAANLQNYIIIV